MISRTVHNCIPENELENNLFESYKTNDVIDTDNLIDIDILIN